ncbi:hypothetical protein ASG43_06450 [Aureimonas sp. Leaf454]|uniref:Tim44 domain-containing protein n=1 Tax=Aureimonas sp. Leaf454 TaxID=1736381 RepID=UPI0006F4890B|nr:Tim44 domain-containing protein [Aureimonas sp. Leaf454]KQT50892.1 hypothetical protein ASG43_06450 [Aureimonas sp. Leaf454]
MLSSRTFRFASLYAGLVMAFSMVAVDHADARRGGSFGSRGGRTFQSAPATNTAPRTVAPVERSMTPNAGPASTAANRNAAGAQRPGFMNGFGGSLLRGLAIGGLFGLLLGHGFGGMAGFMGLLLQVLLIGGAIWLVMRFMRSRSASQPAMAGMGNSMNRSGYQPSNAPQANAPRASGGGLGGLGGLGAGLGGRSNAARGGNPDELGIRPDDFDTFERILGEVQSAYGREDYGTLRRLATPEMMSYLSEELGSNASKGLRNDVSDVRLLQGDLAESWREGSRDYATVAMRYSSVDATVERSTGRVVDGDATAPSESTEIWTFVRDNRGPWQLSAIQEA